jgi:NADH-quinone oxidoreductase subunit K
MLYLIDNLITNDFFIGYILPLQLLLVSTYGLLFIAKKNIILNIICFEIMFAAVNFNLAYSSCNFDDAGGIILVFFCLVVAGCEAAVGLSIILALYKKMGAVTSNSLVYLKM